MVTEGTLAFAKESRGLFLDDKCYSNKRTYKIKCPPEWRLSTFLTVDFQIDDHFLAAVEGRNVAHGRLRSLEFGMHFVIGVRVQSAEPVISVGIGEIAADGVGTQIFQKHDAIG